MDRLEALAVQISRDGEIKKSGGGYSVRCPSHDDSTPSLTVSERKDGEGVVIRCHAGCTAEEICRSKGMTTADLFYGDLSNTPPAKPKKSKPRKTYGDAEAAIGAARHGVINQHGEIEYETCNAYLNGDNEPFGFAVRFDLPNAKKEFRQIVRNADGLYELSAGAKKWPLYRQNDLPANGPIYVHEGEKACDAGRKAGLPSTCSKGGSNAANHSDWSAIAGRDVVILPDNDVAGENYAADATRILHGLTPPAMVRIVRLPGRPKDGGDIADLVAECPDDDELAGLRQTVEVMADEAVPEEPEDNAPLPRLMLQPFSEVEAREIDWLWPMRIVSGGLTIVTGAVGQTKSMLTIDLATRVSLGAKHPDASGDCRRGDVLLFGHEDAIHEVVKPRLVAAGADCSRVFYVHGKARDPKCTDPDEAERVLFGEDIETLRRTMKQKPSIKLLIFDPLPEFIRGDHNAAAEVREALMPLNKLAQEFGVAIVAICHQNKKIGLSAVQSIAGSGGFSQVARTVIAVVNDPDDESTGFDRKRLMVVAKSNYGGVNEAQAYRLVDRGEGRAAIEWLPGVVEVDADAVVRGGGKEGDGRKTADLDAAVALVREIMGRSAGVTPAREAEEEMKRAGHSRNTQKEAKKAAGVRSRKSGMADGWVWEWDGKPSPASGEPVALDEWAANS